MEMTPDQLLDTFRDSHDYLAVRQLQSMYPSLPRRTLQRWLCRLVKDQHIERQGSTKGSCYRLIDTSPGEARVVLRESPSLYVMTRVMQQVVNHPEQPVSAIIHRMVAPRVKSRIRKNLQKKIEKELTTLTTEELQQYYRLSEGAIRRWLNSR